MGNVHLTGEKKMGVRTSPDAPIVWKVGEPFVFGAEEGLEPAQLCATLHVDKTVKLEKTRFRWISEDTFAAPPDHTLVECEVPLVMETLSTQCSLPRAWPEGRYRVDVFFGSDEKAAGGVSFTVVCLPGQQQLANAVLMHQGRPFERMTRDFGELSVRFESSFFCHVRENSRIEWFCEEKSLLSLELPQGKHDVFTSSISIKAPWPAGEYRVVLVLNGATVYTKRFLCEDSWGCGVVSKTTGYELDTESGELFAEFNRGEKVEIKEKAEVLWQFGDHTDIATVHFEPGLHRTITSNLSLPKLWPSGPYNVSLYIDGELVCRRSFKINEKQQ